METGGLARKEVQVIDTYFNYWREHIKAIEDEHRVAQFEHILSQVAAELYGPRIAFELVVRFFLDDKEPLPMATDRQEIGYTSGVGQKLPGCIRLPARLAGAWPGG